MPTPSATPSLRRLCAAQTPLGPPDIALLERLAESLPLFAELARADVFIDCATYSPDVAVVVAEANPQGRSLYRMPVVGQLALRANEPGVLETLVSGRPTPGRRGVTQEGIPVRQSVVPIRAPDGRTVGVLIMEQDISAELRQETWLGVLSETTEQLTETLLGMAQKVQTLPSLLHEGLLILDAGGKLSYANPTALRFLSDLGWTDDPVGRQVQELPLQYIPEGHDAVVTRHLEAAAAAFLLRAVPMLLQQQQVGQIILLRDITEIRAKEQELMVKSAVIREIHHRVKNNLQTIASLLRLQARRTDNPEVRQVFAESINRIASIATVHEVLAKGGIELVDLRQMATDIARLVRGSVLHPDRHIAVDVRGDDAMLPSDKATSVALIINELLQNALEHGFDGRDDGLVQVEITDRGSQIAVAVADDGAGLPQDFALSSAGQLGLTIVRTLVEHDLKGRLTIAARSGGGTAVQITFPKGEGEAVHVRSEDPAGRR